MIWLLLPLCSVENRYRTDRRQLSIGGKSATLYGIRVIIELWHYAWKVARATEKSVEISVIFAHCQAHKEHEGTQRFAIPRLCVSLCAFVATKRIFLPLGV